METVIKIGAEAGQGAFVMGRLLARLFNRAGYYVFGYPEYPSLIRGGHNSVAIVVSDKPIYTIVERNDIILAVNQNAVKFHAPFLSPNGIILVPDTVKANNAIVIPVTKILEKTKAEKKMANMALLGALTKAAGLNVELLKELIADEFGRKGQEVVLKNQQVAQLGYDSINIKVKMPPNPAVKNYVMTGNEAIALGAVAGGLKLYFAYPMTPATNVLHYLVKMQEKFGITVVQPEDEISAANMMVGANFAGKRAMVGTSGGGFALMTETVGMAALSETPAVFYIAQRVGPSTGMPTWTEQGDLFQILGASQGEFLRIILAPGTAEEAYYLSAEALNLAEEFQVPVFLLTDKFLAESYYAVPELKPVEIRRGKIIENPEGNGRFKRYAITEDGISPRTLPGTPKGMHVATSYEHREDSFTTEDFKERALQVEKRLKKLNSILRKAIKPKAYGSGDVEIVVWGSQIGPALRAAELLESEGISAKVIHYTWLYPLSQKLIAFSPEKAIFVENNRTGLFQKLVQMETAVSIKKAIRKTTGRPLTAEQIVKGVKELLNKEGEFVITEETFEPFEFYAPWRY